MFRKIVGPRPGERLRVERLRFAVVGRDLPDIEQYAPVRIVVTQADERPCLADDDAQFLDEFAPQSREWIFTGFELAAREFPATRHVPPARALRDQDAAIRVRNRAGNHMNFRWTHHPWSVRAMTALLAAGLLQRAVAVLELPA